LAAAIIYIGATIWLFVNAVLDFLGVHSFNLYGLAGKYTDASIERAMRPTGAGNLIAGFGGVLLLWGNCLGGPGWAPTVGLAVLVVGIAVLGLVSVKVLVKA
jgi:hypothetical protein